MKKNRIFAIIAILAITISGVLVFQACKKTTAFSCNPEINTWATQNRDSFHNITRKQLALLPVSVQNAIYLTLTTEEQRKLWVEKMNIVKEEWPKPIKIKVDELAEIVHLYEPDLYGRIDDKIDNAINDWEKEMLLCHMDTIDYLICFYLLETQEEYDLITNCPEKIDYSWFDFPENINLVQKAPPGPNGNNDCMCKSGLISLKCGADFKCVENKNNCNQTTAGCGLLKLYPCNGICDQFPSNSNNNVQY